MEIARNSNNSFNKYVGEDGITEAFSGIDVKFRNINYSVLQVDVLRLYYGKLII